VAQTFFVDEDVKAKTQLDSVTTLVDAKHVMARLDDSKEAREQVAFADRIILNKVDLATADELDAVEARLRAQGVRVFVDRKDVRFSDKIWGWIKKGVPIRIEIGPRDVESRKVCVQRRDQPVTEKQFADKEDFIRQSAEILDQIHHSLLERATAFRDANIATCAGIDDFHAHWAGENPGWLYTAWAGTPEQEEELSKQHKIAIRCLPVEGASLSNGLKNATPGKCFLTGTETPARAVWGRSY
jgi:prolyl-tRNA synthetase